MVSDTSNENAQVYVAILNLVNNSLSPEELEKRDYFRGWIDTECQEVEV